MTTKRLACCVPFCTRTRGDRKGDPLPRDLDGYEWICGVHWRGVRPTLRRIYARRRRLLKIEGPSYQRHVDNFWQIVKRHAIERAVGL